MKYRIIKTWNDRYQIQYKGRLGGWAKLHTPYTSLDEAKTYLNDIEKMRTLRKLPEVVHEQEIA